MEKRSEISVLRLCVLIAGIALTTASRGAALDEYLKTLQAQAQQPFSAQRGRALWDNRHAAPDGGQPRSCSMCHSNDLSRRGEHVRTHKTIQPMAPASNPERLTDKRKMRKWLLRNCKLVLGRICTAQEKGDVLTFIRNFKPS